MKHTFKLGIEMDHEMKDAVVGSEESLFCTDKGITIAVVRTDSEEKRIFINEAVCIAMNEHTKIGSMSDGYHTFDELYDFRKAYNACLFNEWYHSGKYNVHKSYKHNDGELCFGGRWFVVVATTEFGQITNHYENKDWQLFNVEEVEKAKDPWDGHTPKDALERLMNTACKSLIIGG